MALIKAEITGLKPLLLAMRNLEKKVRTKTLRKAVKAGEKPIIRSARAKVRVRTRLLRKSIGDKIKVYPSGVVVGMVGPRTGFKKNKQGARVMTRLGEQYKAAGEDPTKYAHLVELGARPHMIGKGSSLRKNIQGGGMHPGAHAYPFMRPAMEQNRAASRDAMAAVIRQALS